MDNHTLDDFEYTTVVTKQCTNCSYLMTHEKIDRDASVANTRKGTIMRAMEYCPYCSQWMPTIAYHFSCTRVPMTTITIEEDIA